MDAKGFVDDLMTILDDELEGEVRSIETFEEVGILTADAGLVVTMRDGREFQITVVQSKTARD